jgi:hypothetical protein
MAVPGETACRPVMPCAQGRWGDIPVDGATEHVDGSYAGGQSDGSDARPWTTIGEAVSAAAPFNNKRFSVLHAELERVLLLEQT